MFMVAGPGQIFDPPRERTWDYRQHVAKSQNQGLGTRNKKDPSEDESFLLVAGPGLEPGTSWL